MKKKRLFLIHVYWYMNNPIYFHDLFVCLTHAVSAGVKMCLELSSIASSEVSEFVSLFTETPHKKIQKMA